MKHAFVHQQYKIVNKIFQLNVILQSQLENVANETMKYFSMYFNLKLSKTNMYQQYKCIIELYLYVFITI